MAKKISSKLHRLIEQRANRWLNSINTAQAGTYEWYQQKAGKLSASQFPTCMAKTYKGEKTVGAIARLDTILVEQVTTNSSSLNDRIDALEWHAAFVGFAKTLYSKLNPQALVSNSFNFNSEYEPLNSMVDGLVYENGELKLLEVKCLHQKNATMFMANRTISKDYEEELKMLLVQCDLRKAIFLVYYPDAVDIRKAIAWVEYEITEEDFIKTRQDMDDLLNQINTKAKELENKIDKGTDYLFANLENTDKEQINELYKDFVDEMLASLDTSIRDKLLVRNNENFKSKYNLKVENFNPRLNALMSNFDFAPPQELITKWLEEQKLVKQ